MRSLGPSSQTPRPRTPRADPPEAAALGPWAADTASAALWVRPNDDVRLGFMAEARVVQTRVSHERAGYDAVAISCFLDPGVKEAGGMVGIPVLSACESAILVSCLVARSFGLIALDRTMAEHLRGLVDRLGTSARVRVVAGVDPPFDGHALGAAFAGSSAFVDRMYTEPRRLVAAGVDLVIPAEGLLNVALVCNGLAGSTGCRSSTPTARFSVSPRRWCICGTGPGCRCRGPGRTRGRPNGSSRACAAC